MKICPIHGLLSILLMITTTSLCSIVQAQATQWQLGAGLGTLNFRLYPGSGHTKTYVLPLPYFIYHSDYLEIDRGIRGILPSDSNWYLDFSADFGLPVNSTDSPVRTGMPDLDAMVQIGPSLEYTLYGRRNAEREFRLELPLRTAISVNIDHLGNQGWIVEPRLVYEKHRTGHEGLYAKAKAGLRYASQDYHAYYYDVDPNYETPQRTAFDSIGGYSGIVIDLSAAWRDDEVLFWGILRYQNLNHSVIQDSPLVEDKNYYFIGIGITWVLASGPE